MNLSQEAKQLAGLLAKQEIRVVFAESCTAGLVAASLAHMPGISDFLCGSAVTYREATKQAWLDVSPTALKRHTAVSRAVTQEMARNVLKKTPEADWSAAVTGHLGPNAPAELDGKTFVAVARRRGKRLMEAGTSAFQLAETTRVRRQQEAARLVLRTLRETLEKT